MWKRRNIPPPACSPHCSRPASKHIACRVRMYRGQAHQRLIFGDNGVGMFVCRGAAAQEAQDLTTGSPQFMPLAGENRDGIARLVLPQLAFDADFSCSMGDVIDFLGDSMKMFLGGATHRQARLGKALLADAGISMREQFADFRSVLGGERSNLVELLNVHNGGGV